MLGITHYSSKYQSAVFVRCQSIWQGQRTITKTL
uniref:Uncharacterized protein n=1 Tax=Anguilla anguilla TaxID=7936 RepID=A0A0E9SP46_ANGAN